jgi:hypothetical protein
VAFLVAVAMPIIHGVTPVSTDGGLSCKEKDESLLLEKESFEVP